MKKLVFLLIFAVLLSFIFTGCVLNTTTSLLAENAGNITVLPETTQVPEVVELKELDTQASSSPSMASGVDNGLNSLPNITNFAIFICFNDENVIDVQNALSPTIIDMFNASDNSLRNFYQEMSYGSLTIDTLFPRNEDNSYFVYRAPYNRSYYAGITANSGTSRTGPESTLLNAAVNAAKDKFDYGDNILDGNTDNYIDMVSFVVSGQQTNWGGLLWPHAWALDAITSPTKFSSAKLNNICVNEFSFTFIDTYKVGYICHETGHVLGMPDLYHYNYDKDKSPAGYWDLMHLNCTTPQFTTTYMRYKYLNFVDDSQVVTLVKGGTYTLKPTTITRQDEVLAYKIEINEYESIWIEYRNINVSTYDCELSGSGLIVYRINNKVTGNENGKYQSISNPDELYIYRPKVGNSEATSLNYAYVSENNLHFPTIGVDAAIKTKYNQMGIYLTDGTNTGIIVTPTVQNNQSITFTVNLASYDRSSITEIKVFDEPYSMYFGETPQPNVKIKYQGGFSYLTPLPTRLSYTYNSNLIGTQIAKVIYTDEENQLSTDFYLTIKDRIDIDGATVLNLPYVTEYDLDGTVNLSGLVLKITTISGAEEEKVYNDTNSSDWLIEGVDCTKSGIYGAKITYLPLNVYVQIEIKILTSLTGIAILDKDTVTIVRTGGTPKLNVVGVNADGSFRSMERYEYRIESYQSDKYWTAQTLTVTYLDNPDFTCSTSIYVVEGVLERIDVTKPTITQYSFGSKLNLNGGILRFEYAGGQSVSIAMDSYYSAFNGVFTPDRIGEQSLSVKIDGYTCTLVVKVLSKSSSLLSIIENEKNYINIVGSIIYLKKEYTLQSFYAIFMSYLDITFTYNNTLYVNNITYPNLKIGNKVKLILSNGDKTISTYSIMLMGDTNFDGEFNSLDINGMVVALMQERTNIPYLDINYDGMYSLTDFVMLIAILEER